MVNEIEQFEEADEVEVSQIEKIGEVEASPIEEIDEIEASPIEEIGEIEASPIEEIGEIEASPIEEIGEIEISPEEAEEVEIDHLVGTVKWFSDAKGYGFIAQGSGEDIFVHFSAIQEEGYRSLKEGQQVAYEIEQTDRGPQAVNVVKLS